MTLDGLARGTAEQYSYTRMAPQVTVAPLTRSIFCNEQNRCRLAESDGVVYGAIMVRRIQVVHVWLLDPLAALRAR